MLHLYLFLIATSNLVIYMITSVGNPAEPDTLSSCAKPIWDAGISDCPHEIAGYVKVNNNGDVEMFNQPGDRLWWTASTMKNAAGTVLPYKSSVFGTGVNGCRPPPRPPGRVGRLHIPEGLMRLIATGKKALSCKLFHRNC